MTSSDIVAKIRAEKNFNIDTLILEASNVEISNNIGLIIPVGTTDERGTTSRKGTIRYNSTDTAFEGYDGTSWGTLGGVKDVSQTTLIRAETSPNANNKQLDFITDDTQRMQIDANGDLKFGDISNNTSPDIKFFIDYDSGDVSAQNILPKTDNTYSLGDSTNKWKELYLDSSGINIGTFASITKDSNDSIVLNNSSGNFKITVDSIFKSNLTICGELIVDNDVSLNANVDISNHLTVLGDVSLNSNLDISNHLTVLGDVSLNANVDISNHLNVDGDVSLNSNVDISGSLNISEGKLALNNNTILEKRITSGSIFKCANFFEDFNSTIQFAYLVRTNGNNNYAMIHQSTNHRIFDRYTKKNFTITTDNYCEAQFDYWHQPVTQYTIANSTTLVFDEVLFGNYNYDYRGSIVIYRRDESNFNWNYKTALQNFDAVVGNHTYQGNKLHLSPDGSRLFWTSKTSKIIYMLYRGQRNRSYNDVFGQYRDFLYSIVHDGNWNSHIRISNSIEGQFSNSTINDENVHYQFDSNTDGTILTALTYSNSNHTTDTKIYILYSPTLKSSPEGIFNTQTGHINNLSDISAGDIPDSTRLNNVGIHNDYFIFQTLLFNTNSDGIFNISYGYSSGNTNPNIDSISGPIGRIINTSTTVYLEVSKLSNQLLLYSKQIMSNDGLTLVVNDRGYKDVTPFADSHVGCIIILERPTIDVSFTYSTFFEGADFVGASHPVTFGTALAITQSNEIYAGSPSNVIMGHDFIINKIGNQWVETLLELPRNANSSQDSDGEGFGSYGGVVNMSSDGNSLVGGYSINGAYVGVEYYLKESNENFITSYGAIHNSLRADYIYNNFGAQLTSDDRYKIQEKLINDGLQTIRLLNPKKYLKTQLEYKADYSGNIQPNDIVFEESGLIAQELLDISNLNYVVSENDNKYNVRYNDIFIHGLAATKELDTIVQNQQTEIEQLKNENTLLKNALNTLLSEAGKPTI